MPVSSVAKTVKRIENTWPVGTMTGITTLLTLVITSTRSRPVIAFRIDIWFSAYCHHRSR